MKGKPTKNPEDTDVSVLLWGILMIGLFVLLALT